MKMTDARGQQLTINNGKKAKIGRRKQGSIVKKIPWKSNAKKSEHLQGKMK